MKRLALSLLLCSIPALADSVTFTTSLGFGSDTGLNSDSIVMGGIQLKATNITSTINPTIFTVSNLVSFSTINDPGPGPGTFLSPFHLTLTETAPPPSQSQDFGTANLAGVISDTNGVLRLTFSAPMVLTFTAGGITTTYGLIFDNTALDQFNLPIPGQTRDLAAGIIQTTATTPEPASAGLILMGIALLGLGLYARFRPLFPVLK